MDFDLLNGGLVSCECKSTLADFGALDGTIVVILVIGLERVALRMLPVNGGGVGVFGLTALASDATIVIPDADPIVVRLLTGAITAGRDEEITRLGG